MIEDNSLRFSSAQAITATAASTNVVDLGPTGTPFGGNPLTRDIGIGNGVPISVRVVQNFNNLTSLTVGVQISSDNSTWATIQSSGAIPAASLIAGYQFDVPSDFPEGTRARYVRLNYTVAGTAPTNGAIDAVAVMGRQTNRTYGGA